MAIQELSTWSEVENFSSPDDLPQRRTLYVDEFMDAILRQVSPSALQLNPILRLISLHSLPSTGTPVLHPDALPLESNTIYAEGQTITETDNYNLFCLYGATLPDLTGEAPAGFKYVFRDNNLPFIP